VALSSGGSILELTTPTVVFDCSSRVLTVQLRTRISDSATLASSQSRASESVAAESVAALKLLEWR
jgi:hypothetical protein